MSTPAPTLVPSDYVGFLEREYLASFVREGGAAVKVAIVSDKDVAGSLCDELTEAARRGGYTAATIDAAQVRIGMVQQVFAAVARQVDWRGLAADVIRGIVNDAYGERVDDEPTLAAISAATAVDPGMARMTIERQLADRVLRNYLLAKDFRVAMLHLCLAELQPDAAAEQGRAAILEWLRGELRLISALRDKQIFQKIGRQNARLMLGSTAHWLRHAGSPGLVILMDLDRLAVARRRDVVDGFHYTAAAAWDGYEVLRQFIDATDEMVGMFMVVVAPAALLAEEKRGLGAYQALRNRIWDDVRDKHRVDPFSPMVRIGAGAGI